MTKPDLVTGRKAVMLPDEVVEGVITPQGEEATPPVEETQEAQGQEQGTPQKPVVQEPEPDNKVPYERFKQVNDERKVLLEMVQRQQQQAQSQQPPQQPMPTQDEFQHMTPEEQVFYRNLDKRYETKFQGMLLQKENAFKQELLKRDQIIGNLLSRDFHRTHPDVKIGSEQEIAISQKIQMGYDPDDAYKVVMFDHQAQTAQSQVKQKQQQQIQAKRAANVEGNSTPQVNGLPQKKESWKEQASRLYDEEQKKGWQ